MKPDTPIWIGDSPIPMQGHDHKDTKQTMRCYNPTQEFITKFLKPDERTSSYQIRLQPRKP